MLLGADHHAVVSWDELTYVDCGDAPAPPGPPRELWSTRSFGARLEQRCSRGERLPGQV